MTTSVSKCRVCGCSDNDACMLGCCWVQKDLCSTCANAMTMLQQYWFIAGPSVSHGGLNLIDRLAAEAKKFLAETRPPVRAAEGSDKPLILVASA